jgi:redox-sensitive bicupin YhaK (pirin superfamily)
MCKTKPHWIEFMHYDAEDLPVLDGEGKSGRIIAGSLLGKRSPVGVSSPMFYADMTLAAGDPEYDERAIYTVDGDVETAGDSFSPGALLVFRPGDRITIRAKCRARFMMLGGEAMDGSRYIWWNFVSSRKERIDQAKAEWKQARFDSVPGDHEFIPLPPTRAGGRGSKGRELPLIRARSASLLRRLCSAPA